MHRSGHDRLRARRPDRARWASIVGLVSAALALAACGSDSGSASSATTTPSSTGTAAATSTAAPSTAATATAAPSTSAPTAFPVAVRAANGEVTLAARPERVVSLSPTATEMLFAVGAGPQVIAVDDQSNYPAEAPTTALSGFDPNLEAIAGYEPDLVVLSNDTKGAVDALGRLGIPTMVLPAAATLQDTYDQMNLLGEATGHRDEAEGATTALRGDIAALVAKVPTAAKGLTYYHELDPTLYTATSSTFIGQVYALAGLVNIADDADDGSGYPQLTAEKVLTSDPKLIFLADTVCCGENRDTLAARPGWDVISAVAQGDVVELSDDIASRWGPRVVDFLGAIVEATTKVAAGKATTG